MKKYDTNPLAYVGNSPIHGKGLFARKAIPNDTYVGTYEGPATQEDGMHVLWLYNEETDEWEGIDGRNEMRFLNHAGDPNADWWGIELYTIRDVAADEEITFHYGEDWE
ncbi:MAG: SET domain-containing protein-lysine N-methyltransferase [Xanthomonadales bacterium]|nr:SET domain-containing protein-lysine N-methyltransferase [Xanthomonadales bacterium]